jgi:hypothetical protein
MACPAASRQLLLLCRFDCFPYLSIYHSVIVDLRRLYFDPALQITKFIELLTRTNNMSLGTPNKTSSYEKQDGFECFVSIRTLFPFLSLYRVRKYACFRPVQVEGLLVQLRSLICSCTGLPVYTTCTSTVNTRVLVVRPIRSTARKILCYF